jgi:hypothetical protein
MRTIQIHKKHVRSGVSADDIRTYLNPLVGPLPVRSRRLDAVTLIFSTWIAVVVTVIVARVVLTLLTS